MARLADERIVVSESLGRRLPVDEYSVIPSGLDLEVFRPMPMLESRRRLGLSEQKKLILFAASRIENPRKRFDLALDAVELVKKRFDAELVVANNVAHRDIPVYMSACDALLLTSLHEGSPNVVKEALACGLPVVSVDVGDVKQRLEKLDGCIVCRDATASSIASALERVLTCGTRAKGRESIMELDETKITAKVIDVYRRAMRKYPTNIVERKEVVTE
jgi:glycosyltransferase involved in cell wall biosynthesis